MRTLVVTIFAIVFSFAMQAQTQLRIERKGKEIPFLIHKTSKDTVSINEMSQSPNLFKAIDSTISETHPEEIYWIRLDFKDELEVLKTNDLWYLDTSYFDYASVFLYQYGHPMEEAVGWLTAPRKSKSILYNAGIPFTKNELFESRFLYLKIRCISDFENPNLWKFQYVTDMSQKLLDDYYSHKDLNSLIPVYMFSGAGFIMILLSLIFYVKFKRKEFLFYSLYGVALWYFFTKHVLWIDYYLFGDQGFYMHWSHETTQIMINLCYVLFVRWYLDTKKEFLLLDVVIRYIVYALCAILIINTMCLMMGYFSGNIYIMHLQRLFMTLFGIFGMIYLALSTRSKLAYYVILGSFFYMAGALSLFFFKNLTFMIIGVTLEMIIFSMGLIHKVQQEYKAKLVLEKEASLNKMKVFRAQMNPHFIFNALNSIQHIIIKEDKDAANKYLTEFSRLMRGVLESTYEEKVVLADEISLLESYIALEALRFDHTFTYTIDIADDLDPYLVEVPLLLIQPFVENAIVHGLSRKPTSNKNVMILFQRDDQGIRCHIEDNGVGREIARRYKKVETSRGMTLAYDRLRILYPEAKNTEFIVVEDLYDAHKQPVGTRILIHLPYEDH